MWSIDRAEAIERVYCHKGGKLVLKPEHCELRGWPAGEPEHYGAILIDCYDRGGTFYGVFDGATLVGAAALESRFIGRSHDRLQLKFLHVSQRYRRGGIGQSLYEKTVNRAGDLGARQLYISATPTENTIRFYLGLGCRVADDVDTDLFKLEPKDIHLEFDIPV